MLQDNLEANQAKLKKGLSPTPLNPVVDGAYLGTSRMLAPAGVYNNMLGQALSLHYTLFK